MRFRICVAVLGTILLGMIGPAESATISLTTTADGDSQTFPSNDIRTSGTEITFFQSGSNLRNGILEFDLSGIADGSTINSVALNFTLTAGVTEAFGGIANIDIFAFAGNGVVNAADHSAAGTQVFNGTTPLGGGAGDVRSFGLSPLAPFSDSLVLNLLTLRLETDNFASISFASIENATFDAATLSVDYTLSAVPVPAALPLFLSGLLGLGVMARRRKQKVAAA